MNSEINALSDRIYCKGKLLGYSEPGSKSQSIGKMSFSEFSWKYMHIHDVFLVDQYHSDELKVGDFWFRKVLKGRKNWWISRQLIWKFPMLSWPKRPEIFISRGDAEFYSSTLYEVVISNLTIIDKRSFASPLIHLSADIYFQIKKPQIPIIPEKKVTVIESSTPVSNQSVTLDDGLSVLPEEIILQSSASSGQNTIAAPSKSKSSIFRLLLWIVALLIAWKFFPLLVLPMILIGLSSFLLKYLKKSCLPILVTAFVFIVGVVLFLFYLSKNYKATIPRNNKEGSIKNNPPKARKNKDGTTDFTTEKEIHWWDFYKSDYWARYNTSNSIFYESQQKHENFVAKEQASNNVEFYSDIYRQLNQMDNYNIDSLREIFSTNATMAHLSPIRTAEMITTFIQEIPYYLVHDLSCQEACKQGGFTAEYHSQNKPCLAHIPAGVQSPYEFIHNLKGDCDTRSLLAYSILKKMGISCSIWVSEAYGHSILGVGLPIGTGTSKEINGVKHYAVELTAKGYKIGMISPEHINTDNWDITLFYNKY